MTSPKYAVGDDTARGRHYIHPSRPGVELISVTNVLGQAMSKTGLIPWAAKCAVEEAWRVVQPLLSDRPPVIAYEPGSWGPAAASDLVPDDHDWMPCS